MTVNREAFAQNSTVDMVMANFSITDKRLQVLGRARPYYRHDKSAGGRRRQGRLLRRRLDLNLGNRGEVSRVAEAGPLVLRCNVALDDGAVEPVTTDGSILMGSASEDPDRHEVVGEAFSAEKCGIGFKLGDTQLLQFLTDFIRKMVDDGNRKKSFENTLGKSGSKVPDGPETANLRVVPRSCS